jgi:hypothetical protein
MIKPCTCGIVELGDCPGRVRVCLTPGRLFDANVQLKNARTRQPEDWPAGMLTRLEFSWGTGTALYIPGTIDGSWLRFSMTSDETEQVPRGSRTRVELNYTGDPDDWRTWLEGSNCA